MAKRFHLGTKGPSPCAAVKGQCPFGGESGSENHFNTLSDAAAAYESNMGGQVSVALQKDGTPENKDVDKLIIEAADENISRSRLGQLAKHEDPVVRRVVASSPKASVSLLRRLATDPDEETRAAVASNENAPEESLRNLCEDESHQVLAAVAGNPNTPRGVNDGMPVRDSLVVAMSLASNNHGNVSVNMFKTLAKIDDGEVLARLASNGKAPRRVVAESIVGMRQADSLMESHPNPPQEAIEAAWRVHSSGNRAPNVDLYLSHDSTPDHIRHAALAASDFAEAS